MPSAARIYIYIYIYMCVCVCVCVCTCICIYIYIYIYTHTHTQTNTRTICRLSKRASAHWGSNARQKEGKGRQEAREKCLGTILNLGMSGCGVRSACAVCTCMHVHMYVFVFMVKSVGAILNR